MSTDNNPSPFRSPTLYPVLKEVLRGKTGLRSIQNVMTSDLQLKGSVIDLGARDGNSSYYRFIDHSEAQITFCDLFSEEQGVKRVDLEQPLPFDDNSFDHVLLFHVLEHVYNTDQLLSEMCRICRNQVLIVVPFSAGYHPDPHDYFRFTNESLNLKMQSAGFSEIKVVSWGYGPFRAVCAVALLGGNDSFQINKIYSGWPPLAQLRIKNST